ncbi:type I-E CRISPR-associated protein Cse2/CasB [Streptomyces sp. WAC 06725]|uniref:type I-E CRISPR-associated protein Cse2/CasB n=1 Tax=Streptomyces sp. WAC 06725 TaxID=2203209 RepID=UPI000F735D05|nr:type I-E CRISPR-associated protein Cse2/CasB [Streptomyces sp. WAC 06725]RSO50658.1 type I-E CRISPR-associated protein Cse2/CasB [Streptomyces sp. WAC 06725]
MTTVTNPPPPAPKNTAADRLPYWHRYLQADGNWVPSVRDNGPPGEELADLRSGLGQPAGSVMALWPYYATRTDGDLTPELHAEHGAVTLYGLHQQGQRRPMHRRHVNLGQALRRLRDSGKFLDSALDRRVEAAATTTSVPALLYRLRGLITQLRGQAIPLDYDQLMRDLSMWEKAEPRKWVRSRWGLNYYARGSQESTGNRDAAAATEADRSASTVPPGN